MKLYAKIASERNTREIGKGGDDWLEIDLLVGSNRIGRVILDHHGGNDWEVSYERPGGQSWTVDHCITPEGMESKRRKLNGECNCTTVNGAHHRECPQAPRHRL